MKLTKDDNYTLSTGKTLYANRGLLSLEYLGGEWEVFGGYDGACFYPEDGEFTPAEMVEIADFMISQWTKFRDSVAP